jgi:hypothetical protein
LWHLGEECPVADALGRIRESKLGNNSPRQNLQALISTFFLNQKKNIQNQLWRTLEASSECNHHTFRATSTKEIDDSFLLTTEQQLLLSL